MAAFDFPSVPTLGQRYSANNISYVWDGVAWRGESGTIPLATMARVSVYPTAGSFAYVKPANLKAVQVELWGPGGGGGGAGVTTATTMAAGGGGGGGGYSRKLYQASDLATSESIVIGAGGAAGTSVANGGTGTATTFKGQTAPSGTGGAVNAASSTIGATSGRGVTNIGTGGDYDSGGTSGQMGVKFYSGSANTALPGYGGPGWGGALTFPTPTTTQNSQAGTKSPPGCGGNGSTNAFSQAAVDAGAGGDGFAIFTEYYNDNDTVPIPLTDATFTGKVRLTGTGDLSDVSTGHAFQIGPDSGTNLGIDNNEIQGRNNGAAASLSLNISGGSVSIGNAASVVTLNGGALKFPAANIANADVNTFDDYEEGLWTPQLQFGGLSVGMTQSVQLGRYIKSAGFVVAWFEYTLTAKGTSVGGAVLAGLPFVPSFASPIKSGYFGYTANMAAGYGSLAGYVAGAATMQITFTASTTTTSVTDVGFTNTSRFIGCVEYQAA